MTATFSFNLTSKGSASGPIFIDGLPFTPNGHGSNVAGGGVILGSGPFDPTAAATFGSLVTRVAAPSGTILVLGYAPANFDVENVTDTLLTNGTGMTGTVTFAL